MDPIINMFGFQSLKKKTLYQREKTIRQGPLGSWIRMPARLFLLDLSVAHSLDWSIHAYLTSTDSLMIDTNAEIALKEPNECDPPHVSPDLLLEGKKEPFL
jgi:hypothetical protein